MFSVECLFISIDRHIKKIVLIKKFIHYEEEDLLDYLNLELIAFKIKLNYKELTVISYYNPPDIRISENIFIILAKHKKNFLIIGDLNAKLTATGCKQQNSNGDVLEKILCEHDCIVLNNKIPTYHSFTGTSSDILDLAISSSSCFESLVKFEVLSNDEMTSDHAPVVLEFQTNCKGDQTGSKMTNNWPKTFNFNKANWDTFKKSLPTGIPVEIANDVERLNDYVVKSLLKAASVAIPLKFQKTTAKQSLPLHILLLIKKRKFYRKKVKKHELNAKTDYNYLTKKIREEISALENTKWQSFLKKQGKNPVSSKPFWNKIKKFRGSSVANSIPVLKVGNVNYESDDSKANLFASLLKNTFSVETNEKFDSEFKKKVDKTTEDHDYSKHGYKTQNCFRLQDLNAMLKKLKPYAAPGPDGVHNQMLKNLTVEFRSILLNLINTTIKQSVIPKDWKTSIITMIPKKNSNSPNPKDYRPISLTSNLAKLTEKLLSCKLKDFLNVNKIIIKQQSGFRCHRQTKDNICFITQKIIEQFNRGKKAVGIFFDIASAFDKVWHNGIIYKLIKLNAPNFIIAWIKVFLENRSFCVRINNSMSEEEIISAGVPQGAAFSPLLFSIYINDIPILHKKNRDYSVLFADDLFYMNCFRKFGNAENHINKHLKNIENWLMKWRLQMAPHKCNYTIFSQFNGEESSKLKLKLHNVNLTAAENPVFLGIRFDKSLTFKNQIKYLQDTCLNRLNFLKIVSKRKYGLSKKTLEYLYSSLIRSILEYSAILYPVISVANFNKINIIQNKAIKIINRKPIFTSMSEIVTSIENLTDRFDTLNTNYLRSSIVNKNDLITELCNEYLELPVHRNNKKNTILCKYKETITGLV